MAETKPKTSSSLRTPKPKKLGLSVPPALRLPHEDLIAPRDEQPTLVETNGPPTSQTSQTGHTALTSQTSSTSLSSPPSTHESGIALHPQQLEQYTETAEAGLDIPRQTSMASISSLTRQTSPASTATETSQTSQPSHSSPDFRPHDPIRQEVQFASEPRTPSPVAEAPGEEYASLRTETANSSWRPNEALERTPPRLPSQTSMTTPTGQPSPSTPIAPVRDFMKVPNSINRHAVPAGLFNGKSKQLYDCLYGLTRGAINPTRAIRISRPKLMKLAHIGSRVTFDANIARLLSVGLIAVRQIPGEHEGNEYTVFIPDEIDFDSMTGHTTQTSQTSYTSPTSQTTQTGLTNHAYNLASPDSLGNSQTRQGVTGPNTSTYRPANTYNKTFNTNDDDVLQEVVLRLREATVQIAGTVAGGAAERDRWREVGELLSEELIAAALRAEYVSSVPAFFAEHLRRRFTRRTETTARSSSSPSEPGLREPRAEEPVSLTQEQISDMAEMITELILRDDYSLEAVTEQFAPNLNNEDWSKVLELVKNPRTIN